LLVISIFPEIDTGGLNRLALARWACWSAGYVDRHVKCLSRSNDLTPLTGEGQRWRGEKGARDKVTKRRRDGRSEWNGGGAQGPSASKERLYICINVHPPEFQEY